MDLNHTSHSPTPAYIEDEPCTLLFDRLGRKVALTETRRLLEEHAHRLFASLASAREAVADLSGLKRGSLVLGASTTPGIYVLPGMIAAFQGKYPGVALSLRIGNSALIEEQIRGNELDLGVVGGHPLRLGEECVAAGLLDELVLIVPPSHAWARRREIQPSLLEGERLLVREEGSATRQVTERALQRAGGHIKASMELGHTEEIKQAVIAGLGIAFVSIHAIRGELAVGRLRAIRLQGLRIQRHFHIIHNEARTLSTSARAFIELLKSARVDRSA